MSTATPSVAVELLAELFDDAALFPPGNAPMERAVPAHREHRRAWYGGLVGAFLCPDAALPRLRAVLPPAHEPEPLEDLIGLGLLDRPWPTNPDQPTPPQ